MSLRSKIKDYQQFTKFRLSITVIVSALAGFLFAGGGTGMELFNLLVGGFLVTSASIGSNQIWERKIDAKMPRTQNRPLPSGRMHITEAYIMVIVMLGVGSWLLYQLNFNSMLLGLISYVSYVFVYTPSKRVTPWAVIIGAFPGALPPMIGAIAVTNEFAAMPGALFFVQFVWQLPHFWAIAWVSHDSYREADFHLLPSRSGKSKKSAYIIVLSALLLIPFSLTPWILDLVGAFSVLAATVFGLIFFLYAYKLYLTLNEKDALKLMFASFIYLPLIQFAYVIDRFYFISNLN